MPRIFKKHNYAFVDGSYDEKHHVYGWGGFVVNGLGKEFPFSGAGSNVNFAHMRNVAGEIIGVKNAIKMAQKLRMKSLHIYHDYEGCAKWVDGSWKPRKKETQDYANYVKGIDPKKIKITFEHVKGHSGIPGNERADKMAKEAISEYIKRRTIKDENTL